MSWTKYRCVAGLALALGCGGGDPLPEDASADATRDTSTPDSGGDTGDAAVDGGSDSGMTECEPGEMRVVPCAMCGSASQTCPSDGLWDEPEECFDQGVCEAGDVEEESLAMCATRRRLCLEACEWSDWNDGDAAGECEAGEQRLSPGVECEGPSDTSTQTCSEVCVWSAPSDCAIGCDGERRTEPAWSEEICVPAGPFIFGSDTDPEAASEQEVQLSGFFIDRFFVTWGRYSECVDAGACGEPELGPISEGAHPFPAVFSADFTSRAAEFCEWDGGRRLLTAHEWVKAARGPAPRRPTYLWSPFLAPGCDDLPQRGCTASAADRWWDGLPILESYYGVRRQVGGQLSELVLNSISRLFLATGPDPVGDLEQQGRYGRGLTGDPTDLVLARELRDGGFQFRCGRSAPGETRDWEGDL